MHALFFPDGAKDNDGPKSFNAASKLRDLFIAAFDLQDTPECLTLHDEKELCVYKISLNPGYDFGKPFLVPDWAVFVPLPMFSLIYPWFAQHHGALDVLLHPNTGCPELDHTSYASWLGQKWEVKQSF